MKTTHRLICRNKTKIKKTRKWTKNDTDLTGETASHSKKEDEDNASLNLQKQNPDKKTRK